MWGRRVHPLLFASCLVPPVQLLAIPAYLVRSRPFPRSLLSIGVFLLLAAGSFLAYWAGANLSLKHFT
jgi:hypothetical protein